MPSYITSITYRAIVLQFGFGGDGFAGHFYYFALLHVFAIDDEADEGAHFVPATGAGRAGVHMQAFELIVVDDLEYV